MSVAIRKNGGGRLTKTLGETDAWGTQPTSEGVVGSTENRYDFQFFHIFGNTSLWAEQKIVPPPVQAGEGVWMLNWCDSPCYRGCCELTVRERTSDSCRTVCKRAGLTSSPIFSAPHQARCWRTGQHVSRGYGHRRHDRRSSPTWGKSPKPLSVVVKRNPNQRVYFHSYTFLSVALLTVELLGPVSQGETFRSSYPLLFWFCVIFIGYEQTHGRIPYKTHHG